MLNFLYIHGYNGLPYGPSYNRLKYALDKVYRYNFRLYSLSYDQDKPEEIFESVQKFIKEYSIDILIGSSLGGFIVTQFSSMPRIVINPCMKPADELPKIGCSVELAQKYGTLETALIDIEDKMSILGVFGDADELLGDKYINLFKKKYGVLNNIKMICSGHCISEKGADQVVSFIPELLENCKQINSFEKSKYEKVLC